MHVFPNRAWADFIAQNGSKSRPASRDWLSRSHDGVCAVTKPESGCGGQAKRAGKGSWLLSEEEALSWPRAVQTCLRLCASCAPCQHISVAVRFRDCSWYAACKVKTLDTSIDGFRSGAAMAKHVAKRGHNLGWVTAEDAQRAYEQLRVAKYSRKLEAELRHEAAASSLWRNPTATSPQLLLLVGMITAPAEVAARAYVRPTLASAAASQQKQFAYRFVVGANKLDLASEEAAHSDLLRLDCPDGTQKWLALKTMLWFAWAQRNYPHAAFVAKTDLDTFVVVPRAIAMLRFIKRRQRRQLFAVSGKGNGHHNSTLPPSLIGEINWASYDSCRHAVCGCCAFSLEMAWAIRTTTNRQFECTGGPGTKFSLAALGADHLRRCPVGMPYPYAAGPFYVASRSLVRWLVSSGELARAIAEHRRSNATAFTLYADEINFGRLAGRAPGLQAYQLGLLGHAVSSVSENRATTSPECARQINVSRETDVTTGYFFESFGWPERVWPAAVAVHKAIGAARWNRTWAMTSHWTRWMQKQRPEVRACLIEKLDLVHDANTINHSALFWGTRPTDTSKPWHRLPQDAWRFGTNDRKKRRTDRQKAGGHTGKRDKMASRDKNRDS